MCELPRRFWYLFDFSFQTTVNNNRKFFYLVLFFFFITQTDMFPQTFTTLIVLNNNKSFSFTNLYTYVYELLFFQFSFFFTQIHTCQTKQFHFCIYWDGSRQAWGSNLHAAVLLLLLFEFLHICCKKFIWSATVWIESSTYQKTDKI